MSVKANHVAFLLLLASGCVTRHIAPHRPKVRTYDRGQYEAVGRLETGSLFQDGGGFFEDDRARHIGDIVTIKVDEFDSASRDGSTKLSRTTSTQAGLPSLFGLANSLPLDISPSVLLGATSSNNVQGDGKVQRQGRLTATLPVRISGKMPNGDYFLEGTKVILVNDEEHVLYISGLIRPEDIQPGNIVLSSRVADAEIEYTGTGNVSDTQNQGWLSRVFSRLWPF